MGGRWTHCKRGHDLTSQTGKRGGCTICHEDSRRRRKGSPLAGTFAPSPSLEARRKARSLGMEYCPACEETKGMNEFSPDAKTPSGRAGICRTCRRYREKNKYGPARSKAKRLGKYGLTPEAFDILVNAQGYVCAICQNKCTVYKELSVDHCHDTGEVRGLLCYNCNTGLGRFEDSPKILARALRYLKESRDTR